HVAMARFCYGWQTGRYSRPRLAQAREPAQLAVFDLRPGRREPADGDRRVAGEDGGCLRAQAIERDMHEVETKREAELFAKKMWRCPYPRRSETVLAGVGSDEVDQFLDALRRPRGVDQEHGRLGGGKRDRWKVLGRIVGDLIEERRIDCKRCEHEKDSVAIGRRPRGLAGADAAARADDVLDIELLAKSLRQLLRDEASENVGTARRIGDDYAHRSRRISLRSGKTRKGGEGGDRAGESKKLSA